MLELDEHFARYAVAVRCLALPLLVACAHHPSTTGDDQLSVPRPPRMDVKLRHVADARTGTIALLGLEPTAAIIARDASVLGRLEQLLCEEARDDYPHAGCNQDLPELELLSNCEIDRDASCLVKLSHGVDELVWGKVDLRDDRIVLTLERYTTATATRTPTWTGDVAIRGDLHQFVDDAYTAISGRRGETAIVVTSNVPATVFLDGAIVGTTQPDTAQRNLARISTHRTGVHDIRVEAADRAALTRRLELGIANDLLIDALFP